MREPNIAAAHRKPTPSAHLWYAFSMESRNGNGEAHIATTLEPEVKAQFQQVATANHRSVRAELRVAVLKHIEREAA